jgi:hypothetical protein
MPTSSRPITTRDPRSLITPDAFEVAPDLLGLPLATPGQRFAALMVDLAVIGVITLVTKSFGMVLGVVVAFLFIREGFKRTPVKGSVFGRAMRLSVGCLGLWIGLITIAIWASLGIGGGGGRDRSDDPGAQVSISGVPISDATPGRILGLMAGIAGAKDFAEAQDVDEARAAAEKLVRLGFEQNMTTSEVRDLVEGLVPDGARWANDSDAIIEGAILAVRTDSAVVAPDSATAGPDPATAGPDPAAPAELGAGEEAALPEAFSDPFVADSLRTLHRQVEDLQESDQARGRAIEELQDELEREREGGSLFSWLRDFVDELGFGFGWASLYLTVMLSWWKGQTVGKRLLKIRVLRLDGEPITWWTAFERAGGYAAGFATGLLGFAQVFWDSNRQAIHDRIVGTVVVCDGAAKIADWEKAL